MQALKFKLSGKTAIFKRPDVNVHCLFTYSHIHKPALLGILGAICGFAGYNSQKAHNDRCIAEKRKTDILDYPEFYEKLKDIKISIIPREATFSTKTQKFNNSVGYASQEQGNNLIVTEQWLEEPSWEIFVLLDGNEVTEELKRRFLAREFVYIPYLGKNDHFADITDIEIVDLTEVSECSRVRSMIFADKVSEVEESDEDDDEMPFKYTERLPVTLDREDNMYELRKLVYTNMDVTLNDYDLVYSCNAGNIAFF